MFTYRQYGTHFASWLSILLNSRRPDRSAHLYLCQSLQLLEYGLSWKSETLEMLLQLQRHWAFYTNEILSETTDWAPGVKVPPCRLLLLLCRRMRSSVIWWLWRFHSCGHGNQCHWKGTPQLLRVSPDALGFSLPWLSSHRCSRFLKILNIPGPWCNTWEFTQMRGHFGVKHVGESFVTPPAWMRTWEFTQVWNPFAVKHVGSVFITLPTWRNMWKVVSPFLHHFWFIAKWGCSITFHNVSALAHRRETEEILQRPVPCLVSWPQRVWLVWLQVSWGVWERLSGDHVCETCEKAFTWTPM